MATSRINNPDCLEHTHSLIEMINMGKSISKFDYIEFALVDIIDGTEYIAHNVIDDYLEDLKNHSVTVVFTDDQILEYKYNPKKLSFKLYETTLFHHIILKLNDMCSTHDFDLRNGKLLLPDRTTMYRLISEIYNSEKDAIYSYKYTHKNLTSPKIVTNDRLYGTV